MDQPSLRARVLAAVYPSAPTREFWIALVSTALLLRVVVALGVLGNMPLFSDATGYSDQAARLVDGTQNDPYYWPVGTSYVLAAGYWVFGVHAWVARVLMIACSVLAVVTTVFLARRLVREPRAALLAGWVLALYPGMWMMAAQPFSLDVTLLAVSLTALFALRGWESGKLLDYAVAGLALGAAALSRPSTLSIALALVVIAVVVLRRRAREGIPTGVARVAAGGAVLAVCAVAAVVPALAHNADKDQGLTLSVNNELNLWIGNNPYTPNYKTAYIGQHPVTDFPPSARPYLRRYIYGANPTRAQRDADWDEAWRFIGDHPATTLLRSTNRVRAFWGFDYTISNLFRTDWDKGAKGEAVGLVFEAGGYFVLALLVIIGLIFAREMLKPGALWFLVALLVAFELPYVFAYSGGRWHYPVLGLLAVFAGVGATWLINSPDRWQRLRSSGAFWLAAAVFFAVQLEYAYFIVRSA